MEEILSQIAGDWFLTEPLMFAAWCTHTLEENTKMSVPMRTGKMRIEYNPDVMKSWTRVEIEERLRFEVVRILLGHPYQRQPYKAKKATLGVASDVTLTASYHRIGTIKLPAGLQYEKGLCFEEYYAIVEAYLDKNLKSPKYDVEGLIQQSRFKEKVCVHCGCTHVVKFGRVGEHQRYRCKDCKTKRRYLV